MRNHCVEAATLGLALLAGMSVAGADDRLWREQVGAGASASIAVTVLKDEVVGSAQAEYLWSQQLTSAKSLGVRVAWNPSTTAPAYALWREQLAAVRKSDDASPRVAGR